MPINFPNSPTNGQLYPDPSGGAPQWEYSSANKSWTMLTSAQPGVENATNYDNTIVNLNRVGSQNLLTAASGLTYDTSTKTMSLKLNVSQSANAIEIRDSSNALLNAFNERGVLTSAGRILYSGTIPTVNAADTGLLWYNTTSGAINVWTGSAWSVVGSGVTLDTNQVVTGAKTFSTGILLSSTAKLQGSGTSKSIELAPTNGSGVAATVATFANSLITFSQPVQISSVDATTKTVLATLADAQTITGLKSFSNNIKLSNATINRLYVSDSTNGLDVSGDLTLQPNLSSTGRFVRLYNNSDAVNGIVLRPKNLNNAGELLVDGPTRVNGNLIVQGTVTSTAGLYATGTTIGSLKSSAGTDTQNVNTAPATLGPLTFSLVIPGDYTSHGIQITNTSTTSPITFYWKREQVRDNIYTFVYRRVTLTANTTVIARAESGALQLVGGGSYTGDNTMVGGYSRQILISSQTNAPCLMTFHL